jgi:hypothetical protein
MLRIRFNNIFIETLDELDPDTQNLILHALKLDIERRMKAVVDNFEKYEQTRFMLRKNSIYVTHTIMGTTLK